MVFHDFLPSDHDPEMGKLSIIEFIKPLTGINAAGITYDGSIRAEYKDGRLLMPAEVGGDPGTAPQEGGLLVLLDNPLQSISETDLGAGK